MGTLLQNGVTLLRTMELLEDMSGNTYLRGCMNRSRAAPWWTVHEPVRAR